MKYSQYFEIRRGEHYHLTENAPEKLQEFVRSVHLDHFGGCLPSNWIYYQLAHAFDELEDTPYEDITIEADCYYSDLFKWLGNSFAADYCTEYMQETCEKMSDCNFWDLVGNGQWLAKDRIYRAVEQWINEQENE